MGTLFGFDEISDDLVFRQNFSGQGGVIVFLGGVLFYLFGFVVVIVFVVADYLSKS